MYERKFRLDKMIGLVYNIHDRQAAACRLKNNMPVDRFNFPSQTLEKYAKGFGFSKQMHNIMYLSNGKLTS
jgi:hypothetical protein